jgi:hypothetical protein
MSIGVLWALSLVVFFLFTFFLVESFANCLALKAINTLIIFKVASSADLSLEFGS